MKFEERTISELMRNRTKTFGSKPLFYFKDEVYTYENVHDQTSRIAAALARLGVHHGDRVVVGLPSIPETILSYTALAKAGATHVAVNVTLSVREIIHILNNSEAVAVIAVDSVIEKISSCLDKLPHLKVLIQVGDPILQNVIPFSQLLDESTHLDGLDKPSDILMISYTSGTTGAPKGVILTNERFLNNSSRFRAAMGITELDVSVNMVPYNHIFGPIVEWLAMLSAGGSFVLREKFSPRGVLHDIERYKGTYICGAPAMFITLLDELKRSRSSYNLKSLRFSFVGSAAVPAEMQRDFELVTNVKIVQAAGQTEVAGLYAIEPLDRQYGYLTGTCGKSPSDDIELKVVNATGDEVLTGEIGELIVKSPDIMLGYWKMPAETADTIVDGWLHTGDLARIDQNGYVYIVDRIKHMINTSGTKVFPTEVENVILMIQEVHEVAVIGIPDSVRGESVEAFIVLRDGATIHAQQIIEYCRKNLALYKVPRKIHFIDELPKTVTNKIRKLELRNRFIDAK